MKSRTQMIAEELVPIRDQLAALSARYRDFGEDRLGWEVLNAVRALDESVMLANLYSAQSSQPADKA